MKKWHESLGRMALGAAAVFGFAVAVSADVKIDPALADYQKADGVSGTIKSVGSDTLNNVMALWTEGFKGHYQNVKIEVEGKGSATAPPALIEGTSTFGPMSRAMKADEIAAFEKKYGYKPTSVTAGIDTLAVFVHKDNPIKGLTLQQVDAIFSKTRKGGGKDDIKTWGQLGLTGDWADKPIVLFGRNSASGTYGFFKDHAIFKGDYKDTVKEQAGSAGVIKAITDDKYAIGYSGIGYLTAGVRAVPLASDPKDEFVAAAPERAYDGSYPLARQLFIYVNYKPGSELDPLRREFIKFMLSKEGQAAIVKEGFYPVKAVMAKKAMESVGIK